MKWDVVDEDREDFEQEQRIQAWLTEQGSTAAGVGVEFRYTNRNGRAKNSFNYASISLDQKLRDDDSDGDGTFSDVIEGDGLGGSSLGMAAGTLKHEDDGETPDPGDVFTAWIGGLGFNEEEITWITNCLNYSEKRSSDHPLRAVHLSPPLLFLRA